MTTFPNSPRLFKGGLVLVDPESGGILCVILLQNNPDTPSRVVQTQVAIVPRPQGLDGAPRVMVL